MTPVCPHEVTSEVGDREVCDRCGEVLSRDETVRRRRLGHVTELREQLRAKGDR